MKNKYHRIVFIVSLFFCLFTVILLLNYKTFKSYPMSGIITLVPMDGFVFLLIGMIILGIACFSFLQLTAYKVGRLFAYYVLLVGLSIGLAPCSYLYGGVITLIRVFCTFGSSLLLFRTIGYLTLLQKKRLYQILYIILVVYTVLGLMIQILSFLSIQSLWIYLLADASINICIMLSAFFGFLVMGVYYKNSNTYTKKQSKILLLGIGLGAALFLLVSFMPSAYMVQSRQSEVDEYIELAFMPNATMQSFLPLLLFSGISIIIIFLLIRRDFVLRQGWMKFSYFIMVPIYLMIPNMLLILYTDSSWWVLLICNLLFMLQFLIILQIMMRPIKSTEEQIYQNRLKEEIEKEKQEISCYLHDEVLQSLIAIYRQIQADDTERYANMKEPLSAFITQIRSMSHHLYPTMVEDLGLEQSLMIFVDDMQKSNLSVSICYQYNMVSGILPKSLALPFYRIAKELVMNAAKHANANEISLLLDEDDNGYSICVKDNGSGFILPSQTDLLKSPHMGLYTIKKQVIQLSGQIHFESNIGTGTEYLICFPKRRNENNAT